MDDDDEIMEVDSDVISGNSEFQSWLDDLWPKKTMRFVLQTPSLQRIALVKIVAHLWSQRDLLTRISRLPGHEEWQDLNEWMAIERHVQKKVRALPLPAPLQNQLCNLVKPLGTEMLTWCAYHRQDETHFQFLEYFLPRQLRWTMHGTIDYKRTAELMVRDERLGVERRYELACVNCLEVEAGRLFQNMSAGDRLVYAWRVKNTTRTFDHRFLIVFFTCTFSGAEAHLYRYFEPVMADGRTSFHVGLFQLIFVISGTRATSEYLFNQLNERDKEQVFEECELLIKAPHRPTFSSSSMLYYLSRMNVKQQKAMLHECIVELLRCLLCWPLQPLYMAAAECHWSSLDEDEEEYLTVFRNIIDKILLGFQDYDYVQLFWECWGLSTADKNKRAFLSNHGILGDLVLTKRRELIEFILNKGCLRFIRNVVNYDDYRQALMDENAIPDQVLMQWRAAAEWSSSNDQNDFEKQLRSIRVRTLVRIVMRRRERRRLV